MNIILVDTPVRVIATVDVGPELTLPVIHKLIGCDCIAGYALLGPWKGHMFYCDDEALFRSPLPPFFWLAGYPDPVYGRIIVFAVGRGDGVEASPTVSVDDVAALIRFP